MTEADESPGFGPAQKYHMIKLINKFIHSLLDISSIK